MAVFQSDSISRFFRSAVSINHDEIDSTAKKIAARIAAPTNKGEIKYIFVNAAAPDVFQILLRLNFLLTSAGVATNYCKKLLGVISLQADCVNILPHGNSADILAAKADRTLQGFVVMPVLQAFDGDFAYLNYEVVNTAPAVTQLSLECHDKLTRLAQFCQKYRGALPYELAAKIMAIDEDSLGELICGDLALFEDNDTPALYVVDRAFGAIGFDGAMLNEILTNIRAEQQSENRLVLKLLCSCTLEAGHAAVLLSEARFRHYINAASEKIEKQIWQEIARDLADLRTSVFTAHADPCDVPPDTQIIYSMLTDNTRTVNSRIRELVKNLVPMFNTRENILLASKVVKYALHVFSNNNTLLAWRSICSAASGNQAEAMKLINEHYCESALWRVARFVLALTQGDKPTLLEVFDAAIEQLSDRTLAEFLIYSEIVARHCNADLAGQISGFYECLCAVKTSPERKSGNLIDPGMRRGFSKIVRETLAA